MNASAPSPLPGSTSPPAIATPAEIIATTTEALHQLDQTTPEEELQISVLAAKIDLCNSTAILRYGESVQRRLASLVDTSLGHILRGLDYNTRDSNDFLAYISSQVEHFNRDNSKNILSHSKRSKLLKDNYRIITQEIDRAKKALDGQRLYIQVSIRTLDELYEQVRLFYRLFKIYIAAGKKQLAYVRETQLPKLTTPEPEGLLTYRDLENQCNTFEKRLQDLELSQTISLQAAVQIQLTKAANQLLALNIQNTIANAFTLWKQSIATALTVKRNQLAISTSNANLLSNLSDTRESQKSRCTKAAITALANLPESTS